MTRACAFSTGLCVGALVSPLAQILAARYAGRHFLDIITKENQ